MCLRILIGLLPGQFHGCRPTVLDLQSHLGHAGTDRYFLAETGRARRGADFISALPTLRGPDPPANSGWRIARLRDRLKLPPAGGSRAIERHKTC